VLPDQTPDDEIDFWRGATARGDRIGMATRGTKGGASAPPALPVPDLPLTLFRFLQTAEPLAASADEFATTANLTFRFASSDGPLLHRKLVHRAKVAAGEGKSWLIDWWVKLMYTAWRLPLPVNVSYCE
jgi:hypothetical protein